MERRLSNLPRIRRYLRHLLTNIRTSYTVLTARRITIYPLINYWLLSLSLLRRQGLVVGAGVASLLDPNLQYEVPGSQ